MTISQNRLSCIFDAMNRTRIAVLGDLMLDIYISGPANRLSQEAPVPVLQVRKQETRLGGAANVMHNLMSLAPECQVSAFGVVGDDVYGQQLKQALCDDHIAIKGVLIDSSRRTTIKQRVIVSGQQVVRMDVEDTHAITGSVLEQMSELILNGIRNHQFDALIFEDYAKGLLQKDMLQSIADAARAEGIFTSLDPHPGHAMQIRNLSLMTPNRMEAFGLAGVYCSDPKDVEKDESLKLVASRVLESWNPDSLLITLGHQGMALFRKNQELLAIPTIAKEVFDVSGAGDTVIATYTLCRAAGATETEAAQIANHAAGIVVGKRGTATTNKQEIFQSF
ncbi:MAG: hypothetical protein IKB16_10565 [Lentisphaeria bacterium]|nr:hypothetical protein [Lentisphaeria bacterium]